MARVAITVLIGLLMIGSLPPAGAADAPSAQKGATRAQLSTGYSLLYQEASGLPKLNWILMFKGKSDEMAQLTGDLVAYYKQLTDSMQKLSKQYPAMRIDVEPMSKIEGDARQALGVDQAKQMAPITGKSGVDFERQALLLFDNALDEQRHIAGAMIPSETNAALKKFLETTKTQLDERYAKVSALLNRRYFTH